MGETDTLVPPSVESLLPTRTRAWWRWGARTVAALYVAYLVFVVLHRLLSNRVYWWAPFDLIAPVTFVALPVLLGLVALLIRRGRRWRTLVSALTLLLGLGYSGINFATIGYAPPPAPTHAIKVVSWNTEYWDQDRMDDGVPKDTADFYQFLRELDADVYLLHEYAHVDTSIVDVFAQALAIDQASLLRESFPGYTVVITGRDITLSRLPVLGYHALDSTPYLPAEFKAVPPGLADRPLFYNSQTLRTDIKVNGQTVSFYNSHIFQPPVRMLLLRNDTDRSMFDIDRFNFEHRHASFRAIQADVERNPNRMVLAGDLNTSPAMNILDMIPDRLTDQSRALASIYPVSWPVQTSALLWRIDWLFTTPDVTVHRYELLDPTGLSDHKTQRMVLSVD